MVSSLYFPLSPRQMENKACVFKSSIVRHFEWSHIDIHHLVQTSLVLTFWSTCLKGFRNLYLSSKRALSVLVVNPFVKNSRNAFVDAPCSLSLFHDCMTSEKRSRSTRKHVNIVNLKRMPRMRRGTCASLRIGYKPGQKPEKEGWKKEEKAH